jgi:putative tricarboxylic transport membrane protein
MDIFLQGLATVMSPQTLIFIILGVAAGITIGALPGLTATMGVALLLPITFSMSPINGILLLCGIYIGAIYGGSITAILLRTPGTPAAAATALDGFELAKKGEAGRALGMSTLASFVGGTISTILLMLISPQLAKLALKFSAPEYFALALFGLSIITSISGNSIVKGLMAAAIGILLSLVGIDGITGFPRFTFQNVNMLNGLSFIPIMIGLFALSQAFSSIEDIVKNRKIEQKIKSVIPTLADVKTTWKTMLRSSLIGTFIGIIPGAGGDIAAFVSYNEAKRFSKHPEKFGTGLIEAVAAPEAGNNGVTGGAMVPLLTLGIPGDSVTAILLGALMMQGLQPGPLLFTEQGATVYTIFIGLLVGNVVMLILGLAGIRVFTKIVSIPSYILTPIIFALCIVGSYAINNSLFDVKVMFISGIIGYFMNKLEFPSSPIILALILGPMAEGHFRRALVMSNGSASIFFTSPISLVFIIIAVITLFWPIVKPLLKKKKEVVSV